MRIATWNVNSLRVRHEQVLDWLETSAPDVLALQETKLTDDQFPIVDVAEAGYCAAYSGQRAYNGVALLSRRPPTEVVTDIPQFDDPQRRILAATIEGVRVVNLYVVNGSEVGSDKYEYKLHWLGRVTEYLATELRRHRYLVVLGDFNIAPTDLDVYDPELCRERILCSTPEREALRALLNVGLEDVFRRLHPEEPGFTWWDYRSAAFRRNLGLRIDLILASHALAQRATACEVDPAPRRLPRPSDHAPVWADFDLDTSG
ncbi:MAG TPA: exodeoxyribonuclease III [Chromatiales bacterium]|nr:exodeoxyribonuclease III [Chromatiales bacterium]